MAPPIGCHDVLPANVLSPCTSPMTTRAKCNQNAPPTHTRSSGRSKRASQANKQRLSRSSQKGQFETEGSAPGFEAPTLLESFVKAGKHAIHVVDFSGT